MKKVVLKKSWRLLKIFFLWMFIGQLVYIILCKWINPPITITQVVNILKGNGFKRDQVAYNEMSTHIKLAVIAGEDQTYPDHNGFDIKAIKLAYKYNKRYPKKQRGASTISQQVAKNVFLWQGGGFFRKGLEVYFTFMIEKIWGKKRILQVYLNVAEMGRGIYGAQAAAKSYFRKNALNLTRQEAALIAGCLPNPKKYTVKPVSRVVAYRSAVILRNMRNLEADPDIRKVLK